MSLIFTNEEKTYLLNRLPSLELSYEPKMHKKVYADLYRIIPKGPKALIWYTYWQEQNVCLLIHLNERGNYSDVKIYPTIFTQALALGTIIYGTYFNYNGGHYFTSEQLHYCKGLPVYKKPLGERMDLLLDLFHMGQIGQQVYTADFLIVGLPVLTKTYEEALEQLNNLPYKTYGIAGYNLFPRTKMPVALPAPLPMKVHMPVPMPTMPTMPIMPIPTMPIPLYNNNNNNNNNIFTNKGCFKVKAALAADIYHLYTAEDIFYATAAVPTYKASVMLNNLFRNIKENANLDLLEESDDEADFENTNIDKFVDLEKTFLMECVYLKKFKKWQPLKVITPGRLKLITKREAQQIEK